MLRQNLAAAGRLCQRLGHLPRRDAHNGYGFRYALDLREPMDHERFGAHQPVAQRLEPGAQGRVALLHGAKHTEPVVSTSMLLSDGVECGRLQAMSDKLFGAVVAARARSVPQDPDALMEELGIIREGETARKAKARHENLDGLGKGHVGHRASRVDRIPVRKEPEPSNRDSRAIPALCQLNRVHRRAAMVGQLLVVVRVHRRRVDVKDRPAQRFEARAEVRG